MGKFDGKVVLITGGGSGIGRASALKFAAEGATVVIGNRNTETGQQTVQLIEAAGGKASFLKTDVSKAEDVKALVDFAVQTFGGLHVALNNAGVEGATASLVDETEENYNFIFDVNVKGLWLSMKYELQHMLQQGGGSIVNTASIAGAIGFPQHGFYDASKHAVLGLTRTAALEYAHQGIRVNAVCPGAIETEMLERFAGSQLETIDYIRSLHPIGRLGKPEEIANAVVWLSSEEASFVLGQGVFVDGGFTAI